MDEWSHSKLADVASKKIVYGIVQAGAQDDEGIPYIKSSDVGRSIQPPSLSKTALAIHQKYNRSTVHPGDIIFSLRGNTGATSIVPSDLPEANLTQGTARIAVGAEFDNRFVRYVLASDIAMRQVLAVAKGSTFTEVSLDALRKITIPHPPLPEQRKIADILSTWDQAIEKTEALLNNARTQKRALMQQLLTGKRRFPEFEGQPWKVVRLGDVADIRIGGTPARKEPSYWVDGTNTWLSIADLGPKHLVRSKERITDAGVAKSNVKLLPTGSVVMSFKLTIGKLGITAAPLYTNEAICGFVPKHADSFVPEFLYQLLHVADLLQDVDQAVKGKTLNKAKINELVVQMPSIAEQQQIANVLASLDLELERNRDQVTKLRTEKKALMQQLLTGKRRVKVEDHHAV